METIDLSEIAVPAKEPSDPLLDAAHSACSRIAPLWPLEDFVAVNPFLGLSGRSFAECCETLRCLAPGGMQMKEAYYLEKLDSGKLTETDLTEALLEAKEFLSADSIGSFHNWTSAKVREVLCHTSEEAEIPGLLTVAENIDHNKGTKWAETFSEAIGHFCAGYFDTGQSIWRMPWRDLPLFAAWREYASFDANLEIVGLTGFRAWVKALPSDAKKTFQKLKPLFQLINGSEDFFYKELMSIIGWAGYVQYQVRETGTGSRNNDQLFQLLVIRLVMDAYLVEHYGQRFLPPPPPIQPQVLSEKVFALLVCQIADEDAWRRNLVKKLRRAEPAKQDPQTRAAVQAVFCIDVRSEVFRRALEGASSSVQTYGFAGFFGLPIESIPFGGGRPVPQCPVLLKPKYQVQEIPSGAGVNHPQALNNRKQRRQLTHAWNSFKTSAISCFSFVETSGLGFASALFWNTYLPQRGRQSTAPKCTSTISFGRAELGGIPFADQVALAEGVLRNMGLTANFARLVLFCGHGSTTVNNPYAASLDCGACGGHAGDLNARICAAILNDPSIRNTLGEKGIFIPEDTWFLGGLHNTTTDEVLLHDLGSLPASHCKDVKELQALLKQAGLRARSERATALGLHRSEESLDTEITLRSRDWSQVRPEWGLAGNAAFIAAPRTRTQNADLEGRVFLHSYDHHSDHDNRVLELIMCAPMIVANWINLQYFGSTVNNAVFGSGDKVIHNVTGMVGVCLGNGGDLQTGLPLQSVHNGKQWVHEPLRLHVFLEAPRSRIDAVIARHQEVRQLVENGWLLLFSIDDDGTIHGYRSGWSRVQ